MIPRFEISGPDRANGTRIAITIGAIVVGFVLLLWGASALLGAVFSEPPLTTPESAESAEATVSTPAAAVVESQPVPPVVETSPVAPAPVPAPAPKPTPASLGVVVIDAGHQGKGDSTLEPIGPGSSQKKARVTSGTSGVSTRNPESLVTLQIALKLRAELTARGAKVVMVRTSQDVNISNSERAKIGNEANADLVVRLHCDGAEDRSRTGLSTLVPGKNQWTGPIVSESARAGQLVHRAVIASSGAIDRGVVERTDLSGFNWSTRPSVLVEMGFMSNAAEDRKLASAQYQAELVGGLADGVAEYLKTN